ncbi:F1F0 ATP synthase subunit G [Pichia kluyveri]|uniref:F1F0 ATP synthase subunit G n=1 Tax=Pichia kluyveri TaxID=36015 RepID=A0AAV5QZ67_PICKL|nr:F1F0 ATP synthase subunit G [Pichia kluyveri]
MFARQSLRTASALRNTTARRSASSLAATVQSLSEKSIYYGKVAVELSKAVYVKEGLQPPTVAEFTKVYECAVAESKKFAKDPNALLALVAKNAQGFSKDEILRYICYFIQVVGFFSLGEIIGRRNVVGYAEHH